MDSLATSDADFGPKGWGAKADRVLACLAVRSVVVAARIMIVYCGVGVLRFSFAACSDLQGSFFVACDSKRLQAGFRGRRVLFKCENVSCTAAASVHDSGFNRCLGDEASASGRRAAGLSFRLADDLSEHLHVRERLVPSHLLKH